MPRTQVWAAVNVRQLLTTTQRCELAERHPRANKNSIESWHSEKQHPRSQEIGRVTPPRGVDPEVSDPEPVAVARTARKLTSPHSLAPVGQLPAQPGGELAVGRYRKKTTSYPRVRVDENDLCRVAKLMQQVADKHGGSVSISIRSSDEEDTVEAASPDVFSRDDIPTQVKCVRIGYVAERQRTLGWQSPLQCTAWFAVPFRDDAFIEVEGIDPSTVASVFYELDRELRQRRAGGGWLYIMDRNPLTWWSRVLGVLAVAIVLAYWCAAAIVRLAGSNPQDEAARTPLVLLWVFGALGYTVFLRWLFGALRRAYPQVEFGGCLSDASAGGPGTAGLCWHTLVDTVPGQHSRFTCRKSGQAVVIDKRVTQTCKVWMHSFRGSSRSPV